MIRYRHLRGLKGLAQGVRCLQGAILLLIAMGAQVATAALSSLSCTPTTFIPGASASCQVRISAPAPLSGVPIHMTSTGTGLTFPSLVTVPWGASAVTIQLKTTTSTPLQTAQLQASDNSVTKSVTLSIVASVPYDIVRIQCVPTVLIPGAASLCTADLSAESPPEGLVATLVSGSARLSIPSSVSIPSGHGSFNFTATADVNAASDETASVQVTLSHQTTTATFQIRATPAFYLAGNTSEISSLVNGAAVRPTNKPANWTGTLTVRGSGSAVFDAVSGSNGLSFHPGGAQGANSAFISFPGAIVGPIFDASGESEIRFSLKSAYSFAERKALPDSGRRTVFSVYDGQKEDFSLATYISGGRLSFQPAVRGFSGPYTVSAGQEDVLFGRNVVLHVRVHWAATSATLYLNDVLARTWTFQTVSLNWGATSDFTLGAMSAQLSGGGLFASDDAIADFKVLSGASTGGGTTNHPPVAQDQAISTAEDTAKTLTLAATDADGDSLSYSIVTSPGHGTLSGSGASRTYTPATNFNGSDTLAFKVNDGKADSNVATVSITVSPVNDAPTAVFVANPVTGTLPLAVHFDGSASSDVEGALSAYAWDFGDGQTGSGAQLTHTYTTAGAFTARLTVTDASNATASVTRSITVNAPQNHAPVAADQTVSTAEDTAKAITLAATDADGNSLTYSTVAGPTHGILSGSGANRTYTPSANYHGTDSFTFKANDGTADSNIATISITVTSVNDLPVAAFSLSPTSGHAPLAVTFDGSASSDSDGTIQTYTWAFGDGQTGTGARPSHTYTAAGSYSALLTVTDDGGAQATAQHVISVSAPLNGPPVAADQTLTTAEDTAKTVTLSATDPEDDPLVFSLVTSPAHGSVSGSGANRIYTPSANYHGMDSFTFKANDGTVDSNIATVSITVTSINDSPVAAFSASPTSGNAPLAVTFDASGSSDIDGSIQTYQWAFGDGQTGTGAHPSHTYTTAGSFSALLTVTDDGGAEATARHVISVDVPPNDPPVAQNQSVTTAEDTAKTIALGATDPENDALTFSLVTPPLHGSLSGSGASRTYTPAASYNGSDQFTFKANDGAADSNIATVSITVTPVNDPPVAAFLASPSSGNAPLAVTFDASGSSDIDGNIQTYQWAFGDGQSGTGARPSHTYTAAGSYSALLTVTDDGGAQATARHVISVGVTPNNPPVAQAQTVTTAENIAKVITLSATDPEDDALTFSIVTPPSHGNLSGSGADRTYTPSANYNGADQFSFKANDGKADSNIAIVSITVTAVNIPPVAAFSANPATGPAPLAVTLNAAGSNDEDGTISAYEWDFGDGQTGSGVRAVHTYNAAGDYSVKLTVTDNDAASTSVSHPVTVVPSPTGPTVRLTSPANDATYTAPATIMLVAEASAGTSPVAKVEFLRDGVTLAEVRSSPYSYVWTSVDVGEYQVRALVTDSQGVSSLSDAVTLTVIPADSGPGALPVLSFSVPPLLSLDDSMTISNYPAGNINFIWNFVPQASAGSAVPLGAQATTRFKTGTQTQRLSSYGLSEGSYQVSVYAQDADVPTRVSNTITGQLSLLTTVASDFAALKVFPNPWRSDRHSSQPYITFSFLPVNSTVSIYTLSGRLVKTVTPVLETARWDLTNDSGDRVASGLYLYSVTDPSGHKTRGKFAIIH